MAHRLIRPAARIKSALFSRLFSSPSKTLIQSALCNLNSSSLSQQTRGYMSEMRKSAFEGNILRLLRNEIQYELDRSPSSQPVSVFNSFMVDERPGRQWITMNKKFGDDEEIKVEVTMFDGIATGDDADVYISMIVQISKRKGGDVLKFVCSTWPDSIEIRKVLMYGEDRMTRQPCVGPPFAELDDELQESLYNFLESRGINDELAVFLHKYMQNKRQTEYIRWMETVKSIIEKKVCPSDLDSARSKNQNKGKTGALRMIDFDKRHVDPQFPVQEIYLENKLWKEILDVFCTGR